MNSNNDFKNLSDLPLTLNATQIFHSRLPEAGAHLKIGLMHMLDFFAWKGTMTAEEYEQRMLDGTNMIYRVIKEQASAFKNDEPTVKFISKLHTLIDSGKAVTG